MCLPKLPPHRYLLLGVRIAMETLPSAITRRELLWAVRRALLMEVPERQRHRGWKGRPALLGQLLCCSVGKTSSQVTGATIQSELMTEVSFNHCHWMADMTCMVNTSPKDFSTPFKLQGFLWQLTLNMVSTLSISIVPTLSWLWGCPSIATWHLLHEPSPISNNQHPPSPQDAEPHRTPRGPTATHSPICT